MPFTKIGRNKYKSPSGRTWSDKQVKLYYATKGFKKKPKTAKKSLRIGRYERQGKGDWGVDVRHDPKHPRRSKLLAKAASRYWKNPDSKVAKGVLKGVGMLTPRRKKEEPKHEDASPPPRARKSTPRTHRTPARRTPKLKTVKWSMPKPRGRHGTRRRQRRY